MDRPIQLPQTNHPVKNLVDLGCWTGVTTKAYADLYPDAQIIGVELLTDNFDKAREFLQPYSDRVKLINAAVWSHDGEVECSVWHTETNHVRATRDVQQGTPAILPCLTLDTITKDIDHIDFIKFDIEAAEHEVLRHGGAWIYKTRSIFVEVHDVSNDVVRNLIQDRGFVVVKEGFELIWAER